MTDRITDEMVEAAASVLRLSTHTDIRAALSAALPLMDGYMSMEEAKYEIERLRKLLIDVRDNGLVYWEPNTRRGHTAKAVMWGRIQGTLPPAPKGE